MTSRPTPSVFDRFQNQLLFYISWPFSIDTPSPILLITFYLKNLKAIYSDIYIFSSVKIYKANIKKMETAPFRKRLINITANNFEIGRTRPIHNQLFKKNFAGFHNFHY